MPVYTPIKGKVKSDRTYTRYDQCVRSVVDRHLATKKNQIKSYSFKVLPQDKGYKGEIIYKSGAVIMIDEKEKSSAIQVLSMYISDYTNELEWTDLEAELLARCGE